MTKGAKFLIVEFVLPEGNTPTFGELADMVMLRFRVAKSARRREFRTLLVAAGFTMTRVVPTAPLSIVEAEPSSHRRLRQSAGPALAQHLVSRNADARGRIQRTARAGMRLASSGSDRDSAA